MYTTGVSVARTADWALIAIHYFITYLVNILLFILLLFYFIIIYLFSILLVILFILWLILFYYLLFISL